MEIKSRSDSATHVPQLQFSIFFLIGVHFEQLLHKHLLSTMHHWQALKKKEKKTYDSYSRNLSIYHRLVFSQKELKSKYFKPFMSDDLSNIKVEITYTNGSGYIPIKFYFQKQATSQIWSKGYSMPDTGLEVFPSGIKKITSKVRDVMCLHSFSKICKNHQFATTTQTSVLATL